MNCSDIVRGWLFVINRDLLELIVAVWKLHSISKKKKKSCNIIIIIKVDRDSNKNVRSE